MPNQSSPSEWPHRVASELGIPLVNGPGGAWLSADGTPILPWFVKVGAAIGTTARGSTRLDRMRALLSQVGVEWDPARHAVAASSERIAQTAFEDLYAGLVAADHLRSVQPSNGRARPPKWTWDEELLAFDLLLRVGYRDDTDPDVIELSNLLRSQTIHGDHALNPSFRSPSSVARKLSDIMTHRPSYRGKRTSGSKLDRRVWTEFGESPDAAVVAGIAADLRSAFKDKLPVPDDEGEIDEIFEEGVLRYRLHRSYERDPGLRKRKLAAFRRAHGALHCEVCELLPSRIYGAAFAEVLECHHLVPLHESGRRNSTLDDVVLLCPTCHRVAHRMKPSPTLSDLRDLVSRSH